MPHEMAAPILVTKLHIPRSRSALVPRPGLVERLNQGLSGKLTLVAAPAGFGKTALIADWLTRGTGKAYGGRVAWLTLDAEDDSPSLFLSYLIAALQTVDPSLGAVSQAALRSSADVPTRAVLTDVINQVAAQEDPLVLVLDDYHQIRSEAVHEAITFLIDNLPPQMHLVLATREDPPLSLSRLRVRGLMTEIRADDLRFSREESEAFLNGLFSLDLDVGSVASLTERTEGWVAGLQLAALSLRQADDRSSAVRAFAGSHRLLTDYLVDEVLDAQSPETRQFLRRTSILDRFCADLCDELSDGVDSRAILRRLDRANLFLVPLDDDRRWYRYHHLFAEFMRLLLAENEPQVVAGLHRAASSWFWRAGLHRDALHHATIAGDMEGAADLIVEMAPGVLANGNHEQVLGWLQRLPESIVAERPRLCAHLGWALTTSGRLREAGRWFDTAEERCAELDEPCAEIHGQLAAHRAYLHLLQGEPERCLPLAERALKLLPLEAAEMRGRTMCWLGQARIYDGRLDEARAVYREAIAIAREMGSLHLATVAYCGLGEACQEAARLEEALDAYRGLIDYAESLTGLVDVPLVGYALIGIGVVQRERGGLKDAAEQIERGVTLCREWQQAEGLVVGLIELAETYRLLGAFEASERCLADVRQIAAGVSPWAARLVEGFGARLAISRGDLQAAGRWAARSGLLDGCETANFVRFSECLPLLRWLIADGQAKRALAQIEPLVERERRCGRKSRYLDLLVIQALAMHTVGDHRGARVAVQRAGDLVRESGRVRPFIEHGEKLAAYVRALPPSAMRDRLTGAMGQGYVGSANCTEGQTLTEPLSERELAILRLMAVGRSNKEIGGELYLSVNTIRWYASQIYAKLGVKSRSEAASVGRELGII